MVNVKHKETCMKILTIILITLVYFTNMQSQNKMQAGLSDEEINQLSSNLAMKLLLNDSQTKSVEGFLKEFRSDLSQVMSASVVEAQNKIMAATNDKIVALLDSKQKMKFNVVGEDWWKTVLEATNN